MAVLMNILIAHGRGWERLAIRIQCGKKTKKLPKLHQALNGWILFKMVKIGKEFPYRIEPAHSHSNSISFFVLQFPTT